MKRILAALAALFWTASAVAQVSQGTQYYPQTIPPSSIIGRLPGASGPAQAIPFALFYNTLIGTYASSILPSYANNTVVGNVSGGTAKPVGLTGTQLDALLPLFNNNTLLCNTSGGTARPSGCTGAQAFSLLNWTNSGTGATLTTLQSTLQNLPLTPQAFGAVGDGSADDTIPLANWAASGALTTRGLYCPAGTYATTASVVFTVASPASGVAPQSWTLDNHCTIKATAAMKNLVQFGTDASDFSGIIRHGHLSGGIYDANFLADAAVWIPFYNDISVRDTLAKNAKFRQYRFGSSGATASSYGMNFQGESWTTLQPIAISAFSNANPGVVTTSANHNLSTGQTVFIEGTSGITVPAKYYRVTKTSGTQFQIDADSTSWGTYTSGGSTYATVSGAVKEYAITAITKANPAVVTTSGTHGLTAGDKVVIYAVQGMTQVDGQYTVGTVGSTTTFQLSGVDSSAYGTWTSGGFVFTKGSGAATINAVTLANPAVFTTSAAHGLTTGDNVFIDGLGGLSGTHIYGSYVVGSTPLTTTFTLTGVSTLGAGAYSSGGQIQKQLYTPLMGICFENSGDDYLVGGNLIGTAIGVGGCGGNTIFNGGMNNIHVWNANEHGEVQIGFSVNSNLKINGVQVDSPGRWAFQFIGLYNSLINSNFDGNDNFLANASWPIRIESGGGVASIGNHWTGGSSIAVGGAVSGDLSHYDAMLNSEQYVTSATTQFLDMRSGGALIGGPRAVPGAQIATEKGLFLDFNGLSGSNGAVQAYDYGASSALGLAIQPFGGDTRIGGATGNIKLIGSSSGYTIITPQAAAASNTVTFGSSSGTAVVTASAPLTITTATGNIALDTNLYLNAGGRLTTTSAVPVLVSTVSAATTLYYAPYISGLIPMYDGTNTRYFNYLTSASDSVGLSIALGSNWGAGTVHDVMAYNNAGTLALCTVAWTNTTTRATALVRINGVPQATGTPTCRTTNSATITCGSNQCTYLGTVMMSSGSAGQIDFIFGASAGSGGTAGWLGIWNYWNRRPISTCVTDTEAAYTYTTAGYRGAGNFSTTRVSWVTGILEDEFQASYQSEMQTVATSGADQFINLGLNSSSSGAAVAQHNKTNAAQVQNFPGSAMLKQIPPNSGLNFVQGIEFGDGTHTNTFNASNVQRLCFTGQY